MADLKTPPAGLERAAVVSTFAALDAMCADAGVVGDTYPTGQPGYGARRACAVIGRTLYDAPALYNASTGAWPWPGHRPPRFTPDRDRRSDERAEHENENRLRRFDERAVGR